MHDATSANGSTRRQNLEMGLSHVQDRATVFGGPALFSRTSKGNGDWPVCPPADPRFLFQTLTVSGDVSSGRVVKIADTKPGSAVSTLGCFANPPEQASPSRLLLCARNRRLKSGVRPASPTRPITARLRTRRDRIPYRLRISHSTPAATHPIPAPTRAALRTLASPTKISPRTAATPVQTATVVSPRNSDTTQTSLRERVVAFLSRLLQMVRRSTR